MQDEDLRQISALLDEKLSKSAARLLISILEKFAAEHPLSQQLLYTRAQAAHLLGISVSSLDVLIKRGEVRLRRFGAKKLIAHEELLRLSKKEFGSIWPEKDEGKTRREIA